MNASVTVLASIAIILSLSLSGCGYTVKQLMRDDDLRKSVLKDCASMGAKAVNTDKCKKAAEAQARVTGRAIKGIFE